MILMGGQKIDHDEAILWGLFDRIATPDALLDTAREIAADVLNADYLHAATIKGMCRG